MKTHLYTGKRLRTKYSMQYACVETSNAKSVLVTDKIEDVNCDNCKRTHAYKSLKQQAKRDEIDSMKIEVLEEYEESKKNVAHKKETGNATKCHKEKCAHMTKGCCDHKFNEMKNVFNNGDCNQFYENKEYAKKLATYIQKIEIEIEIPVKMQVKKSSFTGKTFSPSFLNGHAVVDIELENKVKQGSELIGCLCYLLKDEDAINYSTAYDEIGVVQRFNGNYYVAENGVTSNYAYPVSKEKLKQLQENLEK